MNLDESTVYSWGNQQEESVPSTSTFSSSLDFQKILTPMPIFVGNLGNLGHLRNMDLSPRENKSDEMGSRANSEGNNLGEWETDSYRSVVMVVPDPMDQVSVSPMGFVLVGCVALNSVILNVSHSVMPRPLVDQNATYFI